MMPPSGPIRRQRSAARDHATKVADAVGHRRPALAVKALPEDADRDGLQVYMRLPAHQIAAVASPGPPGSERKQRRALSTGLAARTNRSRRHGVPVSRLVNVSTPVTVRPLQSRCG